MKISINQNTIMQCETEEFMEVSAEAGFKGVELRIDKIRTTLYKKPIKEIINLVKKLKIEIVSLNAFEDFSFVPDQNIELLEAECNFIGKMSEMLGNPMIVVCPTRYIETDNNSLINKDILRITKSRLSLIDHIFSKYCVKVGFEPIGFPEYSIRDLNTTHELFRESNFKSTGIVIDIYNLFRSKTDPEELKKFGKLISLVHLNDAVDDVPFEKLHVLHNRTFPGEGIANAKEWIKVINKLPFKGYFSLELFNKKIWDMKPKEAANLCYRKINNFLN